MALLTNDKIIEYIPNLFTTDVKGNVDIFKKLEKILIFDEGFIYFANPDSLQLKYVYKNHKDFLPENTYNLTKPVKDFVFNKNGKIISKQDNLIELTDLNKLENASFLVSKLQIKSTVFGTIYF